MKKARHKKEKHIEAQVQATTSAEQTDSGSGDGVQPTVLEFEHTPAVDSREGEIRF